MLIQYVLGPVLIVTPLGTARYRFRSRIVTSLCALTAVRILTDPNHLGIVPSQKSILLFSFLKIRGILTPVCALAQNDTFFWNPLGIVPAEEICYL